MADIESVKTYYATAATVELLELSKKPRELKAEFIPLLKAELEKRKEDLAVKEMDNFLTFKQQPTNQVAIKQENRNDLLDEIDSRMLNGETLESIRIDLHERGIDIAGLFNENGMYSKSKFNEQLIGEMTERRLKGEDYNKIKNDIATREGITADETQVLVNETHARGKKNMELGALIFVIGCFITFFTYAMSYEKGGIVVVAYGAIISGIIQFVHGVKQTKDQGD